MSDTCTKPFSALFELNVSVKLFCAGLGNTNNLYWLKSLASKLFSNFNVNEFIKEEQRISEHVYESYKSLNKKYNSNFTSGTS